MHGISWQLPFERIDWLYIGPLSNGFFALQQRDCRSQIGSPAIEPAGTPGRSQKSQEGAVARRALYGVIGFSGMQWIGTSERRTQLAKASPITRSPFRAL